VDFIKPTKNKEKGKVMKSKPLFRSIIFLSSLLTLPVMVGCVGEIDGKVLLNNMALEGVTITVEGPASLSKDTNDIGEYKVEDISVGEYTVTPSLQGFIFSPESVSVNVTGLSPTIQNFKAAIAGKIEGERVEFDNPEAIIITTEELSNAFQELAVLHTLTGIPTEVVTIEDICANTTCNDIDPTDDTAKAIKEFLSLVPNLKYLILGGDIEDVPSRQVSDSSFYEFKVAGVGVWTYDYGEIFFTDYYYADFADWDPNGNGIYAEEGEEISDYKPELAVSRVPASSASEVLIYYSKVLKYMTNYDTSAMNKALKQAGIFTSVYDYYNHEWKDIHSAYYDMSPGRTEDILEPFELTKQHTIANPIADTEAELYYSSAEFAAAHKEYLSQGFNLVMYFEHGNWRMLAPGINGNDAYNLKNDTLPIFFSISCHSGEFDQQDAAGELVVNAPDGGGIAFIGSSSYSIGILGSLQLHDEIIRYVTEKENPILGDAYFYAHDILDDVDKYFWFPLSLMNVPFLFDVHRQVIDEGNYRFTQKSSVMLGDMLIPVWNDQFDIAPEVNIVKQNIETGIKLTITPNDILTDSPVVFSDGDFYTFETVGTSFELTIEGNPADVCLGFRSSDSQYFFREL